MKNFFRQLVQRSTGAIRPAIQPKARSRYDSAQEKAQLVEERVEIIAQQPAIFLSDAPVNSKSIAVNRAEANSSTEIKHPEADLPTSANAARGWLDIATVPSANVISAQPASAHAQEKVKPQLIVRPIPESKPEPPHDLKQIHTRETIERTREFHTEPRTIETPARTVLRETIQYLPTSRAIAAEVGLHPSPASKNKAENVVSAIEGSSGPTIRVSIGRIDIRAVHEREIGSAPASVRSPHNPTLSLDDYLKKRAAS